VIIVREDTRDRPRRVVACASAPLVAAVAVVAQVAAALAARPGRRGRLPALVAAGAQRVGRDGCPQPFAARKGRLPLPCPTQAVVGRADTYVWETQREVQLLQIHFDLEVAVQKIIFFSGLFLLAAPSRHALTRLPPDVGYTRLPRILLFGRPGVHPHGEHAHTHTRTSQ
jgi:hypothetical protein